MLWEMQEKKSGINSCVASTFQAKFRTVSAYPIGKRSRQSIRRSSKIENANPENIYSELH
jgi:hypothetical protein